MTDASTWDRRMQAVTMLWLIARDADRHHEKTITLRQAALVALRDMGVTQEELARCADRLMVAASMDPHEVRRFLFPLPGDAT